MNYLAHGYRFLESPLFLAGTAVPDWLSVADRKVRVRSKRLTARLPELPVESQQLVSGMLQHLSDDDLFHRSEMFLMLESEIGSRFRFRMPDPYDHRPGFLGHIVTELMLDAVLAEQQPELLRNYYAALAAVPSEKIQQTVNQVATRFTESLAYFVDQFRAIEFLYDYLDDRPLMTRLNQVLRRVTLPVLDEQHLPVLHESRLLLRQHCDALLRSVENSANVETAKSLTGGSSLE